jgi:hypothetical protein
MLTIGTVIKRCGVMGRSGEEKNLRMSSDSGRMLASGKERKTSYMYERDTTMYDSSPPSVQFKACQGVWGLLHPKGDILCTCGPMEHVIGDDSTPHRRPEGMAGFCGLYSLRLQCPDKLLNSGTCEMEVQRPMDLQAIHCRSAVRNTCECTPTVQKR